MNTRIQNSALMAGLACLLGGCALVQQAVKPPQLELLSIQLVNASLTQQTLRIGFRVTNPNSFSLPVTALHYSVALEDHDVADGVNQQGFTLPAHGSTDFSTDVTTSLLNILQVLGSLSQNTTALHYSLNGAFTVNKFFTQDVPFQKQGVINLGH